MAEKEKALNEREARLEQLEKDTAEFPVKLETAVKEAITSTEKQKEKSFTFQKTILEKDVSEKQKDFQQLNQKLPKLKELKAELLQSIPQKQKQKDMLAKHISLEQEKVKSITNQISELTNHRMKIEILIKQQEEEISKIKDQLKQIQSIQKYSRDMDKTLTNTQGKTD